MLLQPVFKSLDEPGMLALLGTFNACNVRQTAMPASVSGEATKLAAAWVTPFAIWRAAAATERTVDQGGATRVAHQTVAAGVVGPNTRSFTS